MHQEHLMTYAEVAELIGYTPGGFKNLVLRGGGPKRIRFAGRVRFRPADVNEWIEAQCRGSNNGTCATAPAGRRRLGNDEIFGKLKK